MLEGNWVDVYLEVRFKVGRGRNEAEHPAVPCPLLPGGPGLAGKLARLGSANGTKFSFPHQALGTFDMSSKGGCYHNGRDYISISAWKI